jgi:two-component system, chemotaxis family, chemotaxis protein CheY
MSLKLCLIVDDSPTIRKVSRRFLGTLQFEVDEAENGKIAEEKCALRMPDVILLDWNMPLMTGIEFLRSLRSMKDGNTPTVIFCTTEDDVSHIQEAMEAGANDYVIKPFDKETLLAKLGALVSA